MGLQKVTLMVGQSSAPLWARQGVCAAGLTGRNEQVWCPTPQVPDARLKPLGLCGWRK